MTREWPTYLNFPPKIYGILDGITIKSSLKFRYIFAGNLNMLATRELSLIFPRISRQKIGNFKDD
jgi:hypothetical protein